MDTKKPNENLETQATRREFGRKAYIVPAVLAAIKATESVANAQLAPAPPPPTIATIL